MSKNWEVVGETVYPKGDNPLGNGFYGYRRTKLRLPNGDPATYHGVLIGTCAHTLALEDDETTYLVRQHRPNVRAAGSLVVPRTLELPGGFADHGDAEASARVELAKEVHRAATSMEHVGTLYPSTGASNENDEIFLGRGLTEIPIEGEIESTEQDMRVVSGKFGDLYRQLLSGQEPVSAQTLAAFALVAPHL